MEEAINGNKNCNIAFNKTLEALLIVSFMY